MFLWHFPWGRPPWPLASTLPCGARTFLPPRCRSRRPSDLLWRPTSIRKPPPAAGRSGRDESLTIPAPPGSAGTEMDATEPAIERAHGQTIAAIGENVGAGRLPCDPPGGEGRRGVVDGEQRDEIAHGGRVLDV